jgi:uncharacterized protein YegP (UPF0339 family)
MPAVGPEYSGVVPTLPVEDSRPQPLPDMTHFDRPGARSAGAFVISQNWCGDYVWTLRDAEGKILETSTRRHGSYESCLKAAERVKRVASSAGIREIERVTAE